MNLVEARNITVACVESSFTKTTGDDYVDLPECSLEDMLAANRIVKSEKWANEVPLTVDPRGLALLYAFEQYGKNPTDLLEALGIDLDVGSSGDASHERGEALSRVMAWAAGVECQGPLAGVSGCTTHPKCGPCTARDLVDYYGGVT